MNWLLNERNSAYLFAAIATVVVFAILLVVRALVVRQLDRLSRATETTLDDLVKDLFQSTHKYFILAIALYVGSFFLELSPQMGVIARKSLVLIALLQSASWGSLAISFWINSHLREKAKSDAATATSIGLIGFASKLVLFVVIALLAIGNLGFDITALLAGLGVGGIAVALAVQNILGDLFASLTIVLDKPFVVGDFIIVEEMLGTIEHIGLKTTRIRSLSGEQLIFSNNDLLQSRVRNYSRMEQRRVVFPLNIEFRTTGDKIRKIPTLVRAAIEEEGELVRFDRSHFLAYGSAAIRIETVYWIKDPSYNVYADTAQRINLRIFDAFEKEGIPFALPAQTVFMESSQNSAGPRGAESHVTV